MMNKFLLGISVLGILIFVACEGDYRPQSIGSIDDVYVVMDSTDWNSKTALAIEETYGKGIETLPGYEPTYNLIFRDFNSNEELETIRDLKNIIFAAPINGDNNVAELIRALLSDDVEERVKAGESFAFPLEDRWVRDQWVILLTSTSDSSLAEKIRNSEQSLVNHLMEREFERREYEIYRRGEQLALNDSLWTEYGWKVRMQHDYIQTVDTTNVLVFRRSLPENDRWMMAWWKDDVDGIGFLNKEWINATRDSLLQKYVQGTREGSYVTTEYRQPRNVITQQMERDDHIIGYETLGTWRMTNDFMGGPFVNFTYYDPKTERLFMIEYGQFAPSVAKRRFVRQFRTMGRTFESDSTWTNEPEPLTNLMSE
ncbi:DUF4837 family protein [Rhodohalobacter sp. 614A]|uniref:DUF4837 family protein n=1 Tax=Rhodohalobacter sp. 614A TaxID=2908649 RepID=UPI001F417C06|nr:DUF4837 family protein [Rhodohalobacter sp. 614A]